VSWWRMWLLLFRCYTQQERVEHASQRIKSVSRAETEGFASQFNSGSA
jgi:hypothetical protein